MNMPMYTTSAATHSTQVSSSLRVAIHCATRLALVSAESRYGSDASVYRASSPPIPHAPITPTAVAASSCRGTARVTGSVVRPGPPYSHWYQPYSASAM
jgi:hypothetical protein